MTVLEPVVRFLMDYNGKTVTLEEVVSGAERPRKPTMRVMDRLVREGFLREVADHKIAPQLGERGRDRRNPVWFIIKRPLESEFTAKARRRTVRDRMWQVIRSLRRFTRGDMQRIGDVSPASVEDYTKLLVKHGVLRELGRDGHQKVYLLVKDSGPVRPGLKGVTHE